VNAPLIEFSQVGITHFPFLGSDVIAETEEAVDEQTSKALLSSSFSSDEDSTICFGPSSFVYNFLRASEPYPSVAKYTESTRMQIHLSVSFPSFPSVLDYTFLIVSATSMFQRVLCALEF
jgi:hypothetical protein